MNDGLRWIIGAVATAWGGVLTIRERLLLLTYRRRHHRLRRRLRINPPTKIEPFGPATEARIAEVAARTRGPTTFAQTSGSSARPKRILYTAARVRTVRRSFVDMFCRMFWSVPMRRRSLFVMSGGGGNDDSLTARLLAETAAVSRLALLQAPYRVQNHPAVKDLIAAYGLTAVRVLLLTQANPGVLYATNPSTLSTFFDEVQSGWPRSARLVAEVHRQPGAFSPALRRLLRALDSRGARRRIATVATSARPLPVETWLPGLRTIVCWTGGYVGPFLERLATHLPSPRYRRVPMYALSTETIETMTHFPAGRGGGDVAFLPTGAGTLYELLPEDESGEPDRPDRLIPPWRAIPGRNFSLVVSDAFGLRRYQTNDLFRCERMIAGLPDLRFLRRRGLEHSFTGEKVTGQQLADVFADLRATISGVRAAAFLTCVPSQPPDERVPHYRLVLVGAPGAAPLDMEALAADADRRLRAVNFEYRDKVHSGRLGPMRGIEMDLPALVALIGGDRHRADWEAQLKFLPLYPRTWEALTAAASA